MQSIKTNFKRAIIMLVMVAIFGNVKGQEFIHASLYNIYYNSTKNTLDFSLRFKAGDDYVHNSDRYGKWIGLTLYLELYLDGATLTGNENIAGDYTGNENDIKSADMNGNVPLSALSTEPTRAYAMPLERNNGSNDLKDTYSYIATFSIPVSGQPAASTYFSLRVFDINDGWTTNYSSWAADTYTDDKRRPFSSEKEQYFIEFELPNPEQALWIGTNSSDWFEQANWVDPVTFAPVGIPDANTEVYISGTAPNFPMLTGTNRTNANTHCKNITFFQGAQVGRIDLLTYKRARVQLNMYSPINQSGNTDFADFWKYSYNFSTPPLATGQWHMLSMPLKGIVSGDVAYGGYPMTFVRKFNMQKVQSSSATDLFEAAWMDFTRGTTEPFEAGEGFAFYVYGKGLSDKTANGTADGSGGTVGFGHDYFSFTGKSNHAGSHPDGGYGLGTTNGIIEFPTYDKPDKLQSHRIQKYEGGVSTFYDIYVPSGNVNFNYTDEERYPVGQPTRQRDNSDVYSINNFNTGSDYQFLGDRGYPVTATFRYPISSEVMGEVLVGNPFMSALDFDVLYTKNGPDDRFAIEDNSYRLWNGTEFVTYFCSAETRNTSDGSTFTQYIAPMQGFFVTTCGWGEDIEFYATTMSKVSPNPINLRNSSEEERNIIRLSARNESGATTNTMIGQMENAEAGYKRGEDITKLFAPSDSHSHLSEVYTLANGTALSMNYIGESGAIVPIGVRTPSSGTTTLKLKGMNRYDADKIELIDGENESVIADITGLSEYEHLFDNAEGGYQGDRFYLRIAGATTGTKEIAGNTIQIRRSGEAIHVVSSPNDLIKQIHIYDIQGRVLYSNTSVDTDIHWVKEAFAKNQVLVVKVATEINTESVKLKN